MNKTIKMILPLALAGLCNFGCKTYTRPTYSSRVSGYAPATTTYAPTVIEPVTYTTTTYVEPAPVITSGTYYYDYEPIGGYYTPPPPPHHYREKHHHANHALLPPHGNPGHGGNPRPTNVTARPGGDLEKAIAERKIEVTRKATAAKQETARQALAARKTVAERQATATYNSAMMHQNAARQAAAAKQSAARQAAAAKASAHAVPRTRINANRK